ncbi:MAG: hypothetical protein ABI411_16250 [Tahibacter sp.]
MKASDSTGIRRIEVYRDYVAPQRQNFYLRVRGVVTNAGSNGNSGIEQRVKQFYLTQTDGNFFDGLDP